MTSRARTAAALLLPLALLSACGGTAADARADASTPATSGSSGGPSPDGSSSAGTSPEPTASPSPEPSPTAEEPVVDPDADAAEVYARIQDDPVPVLSYHQIREWTADDSDFERTFIIPPTTFDEQLDAIADAGYTTVSAEQVLAHYTTGYELPDLPVLLSFDDGTDDHYAVALPELLERDMTATFFLMTVVLDRPPNYILEDHAVEIADAGMTIGGHTYDHQRVDRLEGDQWAEQLVEPREELTDLTGQDVDTIAYPFGVFDDDDLPEVEDAGYVAAFQLTDLPTSEQYPLLTLRRQIANPYADGEDIVAVLEDLDRYR